MFLSFARHCLGSAALALRLSPTARFGILQPHDDELLFMTCMAAFLADTFHVDLDLPYYVVADTYFMYRYCNTHAMNGRLIQYTYRRSTCTSAFIQRMMSHQCWRREFCGVFGMDCFEFRERAIMIPPFCSASQVSKSGENTSCAEKKDTKFEQRQADSYR